MKRCKYPQVNLYRIQIVQKPLSVLLEAPKVVETAETATSMPADALEPAHSLCAQGPQAAP